MGRAGRQPVRGLGSLYLLGLIAVAVLATGIYVNAISSGPTATTLVPLVRVALGPPVLGQVDCGASSTLYTEVIAWNHSTANLTPSDIYVKLVELVDGDYIGARDPPATVTSSNVCAGNGPKAPYDWYLVVGLHTGGPTSTFLATRRVGLRSGTPRCRSRSPTARR